MIRINIQGLADGSHQFDGEYQAEKLELNDNYLDGIVSWSCRLNKSSSRYSISGIAKCNAKLSCDLSLEQFDEELNSEFKILAVKGNDVADLSVDDDDVVHFKEDELFIDITEIVIESLLLSIPMRKVAPQYRDKDLKDLYPEYVESEIAHKENDDRWAALSKLKLN